MVEISKCVIKKEGKFLLLKRSLYTTYPLVWDFPGGKRDVGESLKRACAREVFEELGVELRIGSRIKSYKYRGRFRGFHFHYFVSKNIPNSIALSNGHTSYDWYYTADISGLRAHPSVKSYFG